MKASEAKSASNAVIDESLKDVFEEIEKSTQKGEMEIKFPSVSYNQRIRLLELGYKIRYQDSSGNYEISWS